MKGANLLGLGSWEIGGSVLCAELIGSALGKHLIHCSLTRFGSSTYLASVLDGELFLPLSYGTQID